jgi:hypothetical protein
MVRVLMSAWAVWCAALVTTSGALLLQLADLPSWKDPFWSSWVQTVGSLAAIYAAIRVGRDQVKVAFLVGEIQVNAALRIREDEARAEVHAALSIARHALAEAYGAMWDVARGCKNGDDAKLREVSLELLLHSIETMDASFRGQLPGDFRYPIWQARYIAFIARDALKNDCLSPAECDALEAEAEKVEAVRAQLEEFMTRDSKEK